MQDIFVGNRSYHIICPSYLIYHGTERSDPSYSEERTDNSNINAQIGLAIDVQMH